MLDSVAPTTNYGSTTQTRADSAGATKKHAWLAFDLSTFIPSNATVLDCYLQLTTVNVATQNAGWVGFTRCLKNPTESQVTWNAVTSSLNWNTAGAESGNTTENDNDDALKVDRRLEVAAPMTGEQTFHKWNYDGGVGLYTVIPSSTQNFIDLVQGWVDGSIGTTRGMIIDATNYLGTHTTVADVRFFTEDHATWTVRPRLFVSWQFPSTGGVAEVNEFNRFNP
jgi:hypothetical protein